MGLIELLKKAFGRAEGSPQQLEYDRWGAFRRFEIGTIFLDTDGPAVVVGRSELANGGYDYRLRKLTPDEIIAWDVLRS